LSITTKSNSSEPQTNAGPCSIDDLPDETVRELWENLTDTQAGVLRLKDGAIEAVIDHSRPEHARLISLRGRDTGLEMDSARVGMAQMRRAHLAWWARARAGSSGTEGVTHGA